MLPRRGALSRRHIMTVHLRCQPATCSQTTHLQGQLHQATHLQQPLVGPSPIGYEEPPDKTRQRRQEGRQQRGQQRRQQRLRRQHRKRRLLQRRRPHDSIKCQIYRDKIFFSKFPLSCTREWSPIRWKADSGRILSIVNCHLSFVTCDN